MVKEAIREDQLPAKLGIDMIAIDDHDLRHLLMTQQILDRPQPTDIIHELLKRILFCIRRRNLTAVILKQLPELG